MLYNTATLMCDFKNKIVFSKEMLNKITKKTNNNNNNLDLINISTLNRKNKLYHDAPI